MEDDFRMYLKKLEEKKPVIVTGDMNVAHKEIDLKNPKTNQEKMPDLQMRREESLPNFLTRDLLIRFGIFYPDREGIYSWWSYRFSAEAKNARWADRLFLCFGKFERASERCEDFDRCDGIGSLSY